MSDMVKNLTQFDSFYPLFVSVAFFFQNESVTALKKARSQYFQRCDDLEKAKAISAKSVDDSTGFKTLDKRRKSKDEAQNKVNISLMHYLNIIIEFKDCLASLRVFNVSPPGDGGRATLPTVFERCQDPAR